MKPRMWTGALACAAAIVISGCAASGQHLDGYLSTIENVAKIQTGKTTAAETEQLLGAPVRATHDGRRNWDCWEYQLDSQWSRSELWIGISSDGVVRDVIRIIEKDRPDYA